MERPSLATLPPTTGAWVAVLSSDRLHADQGRCVLIDGTQIALFRTGDDSELFALANLDPFSNTQVISRGLVGTAKGEPKVASPMFKQSFSLRTGVCLDDPAVSLKTYDVRERDGFIEVFV
jgi:nitrite reductase (NADH) small subunit